MSENTTNNIDVVLDQDVVSVQDPATSAAYADCEKTKKNKEEVETKLSDAAECIKPDVADEQTVNVNNVYTKKLTLKEDIDLTDKPERVVTTTPEDYLEFDMFDFVYGLVADTDPRPKNPLGRRYRKFAYAGSDDYESNEYKGVPQVGCDDIDRITVYADETSEFEDVKQICDMYKFRYSGPNYRRAEASRWKYSFTIFVPMKDSENAMSIEEYFEPLGYTLEDVMPPYFVNGRRRALANMDNSDNVDILFKKWVQIAATNEGPLVDFFKSMIRELKENNLKFNKNELEMKFMKEFEDDFEDEE